MPQTTNTDSTAECNAKLRLEPKPAAALWSKLFIPTLREPPAGIDNPGTRLLIRAGYQRAGGATNLTLAQRYLSKLTALIRHELDALGAQEMSSAPGTPLVSAAAGSLRSYKQLPQLWYQITGSAVEIVTFDRDSRNHEATRHALEQLIRNLLLTTAGLPCESAESQSGSPAGIAHQFVAFSSVGATKVAWCEEARYAATLDFAHALAKPPSASDPSGDTPLTPERFHTPNRKTIADLVDFTRLPATSQIKSLVQVDESGKPYLVLVRGDHQLSRPKLAAHVNASEVRPATPGEIVNWFGATPGSLGPVGVTNMPILADLALRNRRNMICGANADDYHLRNITPGVDFKAEFVDLRQVEDGDMCSTFPGTIEIKTAHTVARVSYPGPHHAESHQIRIDDAGKEVAPMMTVSSISLAAILAAAAEFQQDSDGLTLAHPLAPFDVVITPANFLDPAQREAALNLYAECRALNLDTLLDDRDERPGVKFKDADLIGIPVRITVGKKLAEGLVEVVTRRSRAKSDVLLNDAAEQAKRIAIG